MFLLVRVAFAFLLALPCCLSVVPVFGLFFLFVLGSLLLPSYPLFRWGFSLSLPWPFFLTPVASCLSLLLDPSPSVCGLFSSVLLFGGWVAGCVVSLLFLCAPSSMMCLFVSFLSSGFLPSGCLFPSPLSLSSWSLRVSCFLLFLHFLLGSNSALVCPLVWYVSLLGFYFPCLFQVPRSSSSRFLSTCCCWCLRFCP